MHMTLLYLAACTALAHAEALLPFTFERAFTANLIVEPLQPAATAAAIAIPGGVLVNEPIKTGTVTNPVINGTTFGGFARPVIYNNSTLQVPVIDLYGVTDDSMPFYIHATGSVTNAAQVTRLEISIGGAKYEQLRDGFVLASIGADASHTQILVQGHLVKNVVE